MQLGHQTRHLILKNFELAGSGLFHLGIEFRYAGGVVERDVLALPDVDFDIGRSVAPSFLTNSGDDRTWFGARERGSVLGAKNLRAFVKEKQWLTMWLNNEIEETSNNDNNTKGIILSSLAFHLFAIQFLQIHTKRSAKLFAIITEYLLYSLSSPSSPKDSGHWTIGASHSWCRCFIASLLVGIRDGHLFVLVLVEYCHAALLVLR